MLKRKHDANSPVAPGMFSGRINELRALEQALLQTRAGHPKNFMITGERGIGKTSLLNYVSWVAQGRISTFEDEKLNFLVVSTEIESTTSTVALVRKIDMGVRRAIDQTDQTEAFFQGVWQFVKRLEAFGVKLRDEATKDDTETLLDEFGYSMASVVSKIVDHQYDGLLLLIDECDSATPSLGLGSFLKLLLERVQRHGAENFMVGIAGLPDARSVLSQSHPSSLRLFDETSLGCLTPTDVNWVIDRALKVANEVNPSPTVIADAAREMFVGFSEGYPHFIQQFGYCAFDADTDGNIDLGDVAMGAFGPNGAIRLIGDRYYRDDFYIKIQKDSYRQVLRIMADKLDSWVTREEIKARFNGKESVLNNALQALRDRHIILSKEGVRGVYRLQHKGFALWIKFQTTEPHQLRLEMEPGHAAKMQTG
jgi:AAA ATPase domain